MLRGLIGCFTSVVFCLSELGDIRAAIIISRNLNVPTTLLFHDYSFLDFSGYHTWLPFNKRPALYFKA